MTLLTIMFHSAIVSDKALLLSPLVCSISSASKYLCIVYVIFTHSSIACFYTRTTLLTPLLSDYSIVLGYASGLCEREMVPVATRLLTLAISLPTTNQITTNKRYASM